MDIDPTAAGPSRGTDARALRLDIGIYLFGSAAILATSMFTSLHPMWLLWALLGWGVVVGIHAIAILTGGRVMDGARQEGMLLERMQRYEVETARRGESDLVTELDAKPEQSSGLHMKSGPTLGGDQSQFVVNDREPAAPDSLVAV